ncbi:MAG: cytochrome c [Gammaproteobacteria bacterium]|nr:cytochrome c [Gammaproteobacteria bacterium]MDH4253425.1 cytochrome c [Gammaproteobacteria bacterium]MDH5309212.1 cytochrome c [Gammaproteobacteria bacterium]
MRALIATFCLPLLAACSNEAREPTVAGRWYTASQVEAGEPLFRQYCATCHGEDGSATPDWRRLDANGNYPPPPLNGSAHTWHHPLDVLDATIVQGGAPFGGQMPAFGSALDADDRLAIIAYLQHWWPDDIYGKWREIDERSR